MDKTHPVVTSGEKTGMLPQGSMGMVPSMVDNAPSPSLYEDYGMSGHGSLHFDYDQTLQGVGPEPFEELLSPTRPMCIRWAS